MKRRLCAAILVLCIIAVLMGGVSAAEAGGLYMETETVGNEVTVKIVLSPASVGMLTVQFNRYDLQLTECIAFDPTLTVSTTVNSVSLLCNGSVPEEQPVLTLRFFLKKMLGETIVSATFSGESGMKEAQIKVLPPPNPFTDLEYQWAKEEILAAYYAGLFKGVSETEFAPDLDITRAMFVTVLYRMAGSPPVASTGGKFMDVSEQAYYANAVAWASQTGITRGTGDDRFSPDLSISRQELMTMLFRYAEYSGRDTSDRRTLENVADVHEIAPWATEAVSWAYAQRLLNGYPDDTVRPLNTASRAQTAAILCRYEDLL